MQGATNPRFRSLGLIAETLKSEIGPIKILKTRKYTYYRLEPFDSGGPTSRGTDNPYYTEESQYRLNIKLVWNGIKAVGLTLHKKKQNVIGLDIGIGTTFLNGPVSL